MSFYNRIPAVIFLVISITGCQKVLDKKNLSQISEDIVWTDRSLVNAYVNQIYSEYQQVADWNMNAPSWSDEAGWGNNISFGKDVSYGRISPDNNSLAYWPYNSIRKMNTFFANIETGPFDESFKTVLKGQVAFMRAFEYFEMVKRYGGVPILSDAQKIEDDLLVERSKTSECFSFILSDLDNAVSLLPDQYTGTDAGRITKAAAIAFKARVLLYKASPQFNPSNSSSLWTDAFDANKAAKEYLDSHGYGLFTSGSKPFDDLWFAELNPEVVLVTRHNNPENPTNRDAGVRPLSTSYNYAGSSQPTQELVEAFPMLNGLPISDPASGYDFNKYWENRDPRFFWILYNGAAFPVAGRPSPFIQWTYLGSKENGGQGDGYRDDYGTSTGYYSRKAIDLSLAQPAVYTSGTDWIEIRYAEVILNYAEAANELNQTQEAYDVLTRIRSRAGILPGPGNLYGLKAAMSQDEMRAAIMHERFIELCFENKRFWDLRRLRWLSRLDGKFRHALKSTPKDPANLGAGFNLEVTVEDVEQALTLPENYYFLPISRTELRNNPNLKQTAGWEDGTFDPLQ